jgi:hypothetical protein
MREQQNRPRWRWGFAPAALPSWIEGYKRDLTARSIGLVRADGELMAPRDPTIVAIATDTSQ